MNHEKLRQLEDLTPVCAECGHVETGLIIGGSDWLAKEKPYEDRELSDDLDEELRTLIARAEGEDLDERDDEDEEYEDEDDEDWDDDDDDDDDVPLEADDLLEQDCEDCGASLDIDAEAELSARLQLSEVERAWLESYVDWKRRLRRLLYMNASVRTPLGTFGKISGFVARNPQTGEEIDMPGINLTFAPVGEQLSSVERCVELGDAISEQALGNELQSRSTITLRGIGVFSSGDAPSRIDPTFEEALRRR